MNGIMWFILGVSILFLLSALIPGVPRLEMGMENWYKTGQAFVGKGELDAAEEWVVEMKKIWPEHELVEKLVGEIEGKRSEMEKDKGG